jgi:hypothetical protein
MGSQCAGRQKSSGITGLIVPHAAPAAARCLTSKAPPLRAWPLALGRASTSLSLKTCLSLSLICSFAHQGQNDFDHVFLCRSVVGIHSDSPTTHSQASSSCEISKYFPPNTRPSPSMMISSHVLSPIMAIRSSPGLCGDSSSHIST